MDSRGNRKGEVVKRASEAASQITELTASLTGYKHELMAELVMRGSGHGAFKDSPCGEIPAAWEAVALEDLLVEGRGLAEGSPQGALCTEEPEGVLLVTPASVETLRFRPDRCRRIPHGFGGACDVAAFDIVMVRRGHGCGACAIMPMSFAGGVLAPECVRLTPDARRADPFYLNNVLHHFYHDGVMDELRVSSDDTEISTGLLLKLCVPLPPRDEQKAIAESLLAVSGMIVETEQMQEALLKIAEIK
jgi:hypothetical protein